MIGLHAIGKIGSREIRRHANTMIKEERAMKETFVVVCGNYQSDRVYEDEQHAKAVAKSLSNMTHRKWTVRKVLRMEN